MLHKNAKEGYSFVWTEKSEKKFKVRKAGEPLSDSYRTRVPASWVEKEYVEEKKL
jgi:hypothetical protein